MLAQNFHYGCRMKKQTNKQTTKQQKKNLPFARVMLIELSEQHSNAFLLSNVVPV